MHPHLSQSGCACLFFQINGLGELVSRPVLGHVLPSFLAHLEGERRVQLNQRVNVFELKHCNVAVGESADTTSSLGAQAEVPHLPEVAALLHLDQGKVGLVFLEHSYGPKR